MFKRVCFALSLMLALFASLATLPAPAAAAGEAATAPAPEEGFIPLFDGKSLDGWTPNEMPEAFVVEDGCIHCRSGFAHLFYSGPVKDHNFKNFELRAEFKMAPGANSGIFFHTANEGKGKVTKGYEADRVKRPQGPAQDRLALRG